MATVSALDGSVNGRSRSRSRSLSRRRRRPTAKADMSIERADGLSRCGRPRRQRFAPQADHADSASTPRTGHANRGFDSQG